MKKRIFSGFLSAVLVLSLLPWSAMAAENAAVSDALAGDQELETSFQSPPGPRYLR